MAPIVQNLPVMKLAGLLMLCVWVVLQGQGAWAMAQNPEKCLENYGQKEQQLAQRLAQLNSQKYVGYGVTGISAGGWVMCIVKNPSLARITGCTALFALPAGTGVAFNEAVDSYIKKDQDAATIMRVYAAIKDNRHASSDEVIGLMRDLRIDVQHESFVRANVVREMEKGSLCDPWDIPNISYEEFQSFVRPGDI